METAYWPGNTTAAGASLAPGADDTGRLIVYLSTATNLVFTGDSSSNFVALNAESGEALWHANLGATVSNGPISYELDGTQYIVAGAGDALFGFVMLSAK